MPVLALSMLAAMTQATADLATARSFAHFDQTILRNQFIPHLPTDKQAEFLFCTDQRELLYGGAAGGGKSDALLMAALQYVHVPNYRALLLRRTYKDLALPGALMDRARSWLSNTRAKWVAHEKSWVFPGGASITFGYLETDNDKYRYQGAEFQFVGFDELTQFTEAQYTYLFSRLRRLEGSAVPIRMRGATNPGGVGHAWVFRRFIDPNTAIAPFISAKVEDNPYVDQEQYAASLALLDSATRAQLRDGTWNVDDPAALWRREWIDRNRVLRVPEGVQLVKSHVAVDPSASTTGDECGIMAGGWGSDNCMYLQHDYSVQGSPMTWGQAAVRAYHAIKADKIIANADYKAQKADLQIMMQNIQAIVKQQATLAKIPPGRK